MPTKQVIDIMGSAFVTELHSNLVRVRFSSFFLAKLCEQKSFLIFQSVKDFLFRKFETFEKFGSVRCLTFISSARYEFEKKMVRQHL